MTFNSGIASPRPVLYYVICLDCGKKFSTRNREAPCISCGGETKPRGVKVDE